MRAIRASRRLRVLFASSSSCVVDLAAEAACFAATPCQSTRQCATAAANAGRASRAPAAASMRFCRAAAIHCSCQPDQPRVRPWLAIRPTAFFAICSARFSLSDSACAAARSSTEPDSSIRSRSSSSKCFSPAASMKCCVSARASSRSRRSVSTSAICSSSSAVRSASSSRSARSAASCSSLSFCASCSSNSSWARCSLSSCAS
eukprot:scaffold55086_cov64-Phaeocystis_antarctica.AAC.9